MSTKVEKKPTEKPTVKKIPMPNPQQQPKMTEEQAFMQYTNNIVSNVILDIEATKSRAVDAMKSLIQQLNMYMQAVKKLEGENERLKNPKVKSKEKKK